MGGGKDRSETDKSFYEHKDRKDGTRSLVYGDKDADGHSHAIIDKHGNVIYHRDHDSTTITDKGKG